ncbi:hypothetical protein [Oceanobacillus salinisoli]|uniref:hypothetical protein n=1 Tax=Oceanobacillus salinisoli TaxID=2678611 RepID=UPI0012E14F55|nr:hypothetical protein [Oceanobacillus salinisoli]
MNPKLEDDQANELRSIFNEIIEDKQEQIQQEKAEPEEKDVDILNLPPRREVHTSNSRTHIKMDKPLIRFLIVIFLLTAIIIGAYYNWGDSLFNLFNQTNE